jgi:Ca2+-binding EF-hand superfamily protein
MNILTSKLRIAVAALAVMALPALAAAAPARPVKTAKRIAGSVDSNGRLSDREWDAARRERLVKRFLDLDTNRSGTVSRSEARRASAARVLEYFGKIDVNHDGVISRGEMIHSEHLIWGMEGTQKFVKKYTK